MATCGVCNGGFTTRQLKITCCECSFSFHGTCVKMTKADIDYLSNESMSWRCDPCSKERRSSLRLESQATEGKLTLEDVMKAISEMKGEQKLTVKEFNASYELMNTKLDENTTAIKENTAKMDEYIRKIEELSAENKQLKDKVAILEQKVEDMEQYSRRNCVEIHGVAVKENALDTVKEVGKALGMEISDAMVDACHPLSKRPNDQNPPAIVVKFVRRYDAETMLAKRRAKKDFSTRHLGMASDKPIYVNESLTPNRRRLLGMARDFKRENNYQFVWVRGGKIFLRQHDRGPVSVIGCRTDLEKL